MLFLTGMFAAPHAIAQAPSASNSPDSAVFVASTPCSQGTKPLPGIPTYAGCELIKWKLKLFGGNGKQTSGTYILNFTYGMPKQGTRGFINGGSRVRREGKWSITKGAMTDPSAVVYRLDPDKPLVSVSLIRLNENLLHLLDSRQRLMIGTGAWSYTLNRIK